MSHAAPQPAPRTSEVERVYAIVTGPSPVTDAHVLAPTAAEVATLGAVREETGHHAALDAPIAVIGDSLALIVVVLAIEETLGIDDIPDSDLRACVTVGDLARAAERAMARRT